MEREYRSLLTNSDLASAVSVALDTRGFTLRSAANAFNECYREEIANRKIRPINKDFVARLRKGDFTNSENARVVKFCDYIGVEAFELLDKKTMSNSSFESLKGDVSDTPKFKEEFRRFEEIAQQNPLLVSKIKLILQNITDIASVEGIKP